MNVRDFRNRLKDALDRAAKGETISIERDGQTFELTLAVPTGADPTAKEWHRPDPSQQQAPPITQADLDRLEDPTADRMPLFNAPDPGQLYAIIVEDNHMVIHANLTRQAAEDLLATIDDPNGDLVIRPQTGRAK